MDKIFNDSEEATNFIINLNKTFFLDSKDYIKKYYKIRKIHSAVIDSMINYIDSGKFPIEEYYSIIVPDIKRETKNINISIDNTEHDGTIIFNELFMYKTHYKIPSLTEIYIEKKIFKDKDKVKMLYAMKDSIVGLFKIINYDHINGYVTYQDVFTKKKYKIIDIAMSSMEKINEKQDLYIYNRIITYDKISFGTGIPCVFNGNNKHLKEFIKKHNYSNCSDFLRCLMLYDISKEKGNIKMTNYHNY